MKSGWWEKTFYMNIYTKVRQQVLSAEDGVSRCLQGSRLVSKENAVVVIQWILQRSLWCSDCIWACCLGAEDWQGGWEGCKFLFSSKLKLFWSLFLRLCNHFSGIWVQLFSRMEQYEPEPPLAYHQSEANTPGTVQLGPLCCYLEISQVCSWDIIKTCCVWASISLNLHDYKESWILNLITKTYISLGLIKLMGWDLSAWDPDCVGSYHRTDVQ